jgi:predicted O-linked N-acetylglucosamine transferase (SPINDLY family)
MNNLNMQDAIQSYQNGNLSKAINIFDKLIITEKNNTDVLYNYAVILGHIGNFKKEQFLYKKILKINKTDISSLINLGISYYETKDYRLSELFCTRALSLNKNIPQAYEARGIARRQLDNLEGAIFDFKTWVQLLLEGRLEQKKINVLKKCFDLINCKAIYRDAFELEKTYETILSEYSIIKKLLNEITHKDLLLENIGAKIAFKINRFYYAYFQKNDYKLNILHADIIGVLLNNIEKKEIKNIKKKYYFNLAIISTFKYHNKLFIFDQIKDLSKSFNITFIVLNNSQFNIKEYYHSNFNSYYFNLNSDNINYCIDSIKNKKFDIAFIPDIGMSIESQIISSYRFCDYTVTSWMHPVSTGFKSVDFFVSGKLMETDHSRSNYSENLLELSGIGLKIDPKDYLLKQDLYNLKNRKKKVFMIACLQTPFKYHPKFDFILIEIAKRIQNVQFNFIKLQYEYDVKLFQRLKILFIKNNLSPDKIVFHNRMDKNMYKKFLCEMDIALDSLGWSGGNTTLDCFGAALPVVTQTGESMRSNHTSGLYQLMDMSYLISKNDSDFINSVLKFSSDRDYLKKVSSAIYENFKKINTPESISDIFNSFLMHESKI